MGTRDMRFSLLALPLLAGLTALPAHGALNAEKVTIFNQTGAAWNLRLARASKAEDGSLTVIYEVGDKTPKALDLFTQTIELPANQKTTLVFHYNVSFYHCIQLEDGAGDWIEFIAEKGATESFRGNPRYKYIYNSVGPELTVSLLKSGVLEWDKDKENYGNIRIKSPRVRPN